MVTGEADEEENTQDSLFQPTKVSGPEKSSKCEMCPESDKCDERSCEGKVGHLFLNRIFQFLTLLKKHNQIPMLMYQLFLFLLLLQVKLLLRHQMQI